MATRGSSPLARGTQEKGTHQRCVLGLIPARAGNTPLMARPSPAWRAHPRSRGEHQSTNCSLTACPGSSPLARGTLLLYLDESAEPGLIPARAGNTGGTCPADSANRAHPRSRGEHPRRTIHTLISRGSSPLARGTLIQRHLQNQTLGLIPARAGNTRCVRVNREKTGAHPRSRGEHFKGHPVADILSGSSPLARGTLARASRCLSWRGLIPARAGNTQLVQRIYGIHWAHPRSRGEHSVRLLVLSLLPGSSPLARGTLRAGDEPGAPAGLIPARAGNTWSADRWFYPPGAHPRSRGEHFHLPKSL